VLALLIVTWGRQLGIRPGYLRLVTRKKQEIFLSLAGHIELHLGLNQGEPSKADFAGSKVPVDNGH